MADLDELFDCFDEKQDEKKQNTVPIVTDDVEIS